MAMIYDFTVKTRAGEDLSLSSLGGKVILVVNTATGCGFTPQYAGLEKLYEEYHDRGLEILDFPCNQFGHQAPGTDAEIHEFCTLKYDTKFDQLMKVEVIGDKAEPLFKFLMDETGAKIKWNFNKFLISRDGKEIKHYGSMTKPEKIEKDVKEMIDE